MVWSEINSLLWVQILVRIEWNEENWIKLSKKMV